MREADDCHREVEPVTKTCLGILSDSNIGGKRLNTWFVVAEALDLPFCTKRNAWIVLVYWEKTVNVSDWFPFSSNNLFP